MSLYAFVGIILLIGIVKKNAIMMIDFAIAAQRDEGKNAEDAIFEGCAKRFRPIMMTTMAALFGTLPIALGGGAGAEATTPPRPLRDRRTGCVAGPDALHHACDLPVSGALPGAVQPETDAQTKGAGPIGTRSGGLSRR